jgi:hypothetical protein
VIAEGVETIDHGAMLVILGCTLGQGYGIARPMPAAALPEWVEHWRGEAIWHTLNDYQLPAEDLVLVVAGRAHEKWFSALCAYVQKTTGAAPPTLVHTQCSFGRWLYGSGVARYGHLAEYAEIDRQHAQIHALANEADQLKQHENHAAACALIPRLAEVHAAINAAMTKMVSSMRHGPVSLAENGAQGRLFANGNADQ